MPKRATKKVTTAGRKPPVTKKPAAARAKASEKRKKEKVKPKEMGKRERLTAQGEQEVLTRFSKGEGLGEVQGRFRKEVRDEIRNLKKAYEAGEFVLRAGVWQLVS